jgi:hypothetical protein
MVAADHRSASIGIDRFVDPIVANRFLLWGLGGAIAVVMSPGVMAVSLQGHDAMQHPAGRIQVAVGTILIAACWYLAFLPPRA